MHLCIPDMRLPITLDFQIYITFKKYYNSILLLHMYFVYALTSLYLYDDQLFLCTCSKHMCILHIGNCHHLYQTCSKHMCTFKFVQVHTYFMLLNINNLSSYQLKTHVHSSVNHCLHQGPHLYQTSTVPETTKKMLLNMQTHMHNLKHICITLILILYNLKTHMHTPFINFLPAINTYANPLSLIFYQP